jgi:alkanesulfonate monooxygenase SsuD/methylene tetrahydromethanopterin reductase-like flavin-dependent oxidoreductase (luciferase family)
MRIGLALPQYDYSVAGESTLRWDTIVEYAGTAERSGYDSLWLSDHLFLDLAKYGGPADRRGAYDPIVGLGALARVTTRPRLGTLVLCEALRPASVLAKSLAAVDRSSGGRLHVGIGAGWYAPEYEAIGMTMPPSGVRIERLREAITVCRDLLGGGPSTFAGRYHRASGAVNVPPALQQPRPPLLVGGKGDRLLGLVADLADGWNTCWGWTVDDYLDRVTVLERACDKAGRDPATVSRSLGLYALCGEDERDLHKRFERLCASTPPGVLDGVTLEEWRKGHLVGTVEALREQAAVWEGLGVEELILGVGAVPFAVTAPDDVELLAAALVGRP